MGKQQTARGRDRKSSASGRSDAANRRYEPPHSILAAFLDRQKNADNVKYSQAHAAEQRKLKARAKRT